MRALASSLFLLVVTSVATAQPAPDPPAPLPPRVEEAARAAFIEAQTADQAGDLKLAIDRYRYALSIAPHPNVLYNLADVLRRKGDLRGAAREYHAYLKALPDAPDAAKVAKVLAAIEATPGGLEVDSRAKDAILYVDGIRRGPPPIALELAPGEHRVEAITPISYRSTLHDVGFARTSPVSVNPPPRVDGNLIISGSPYLKRSRVQIDGKDAAHVGELVVVTPGKRKVEVIAGDCRWDRAVDPPHGDILYVYFDVTPPKPPKPVKVKAPIAGGKPAPPPKPACGKVKVTVERVRFPTP